MQGVPGEKGDTGDTGEQGLQGIQGEQGLQGVPGEKGDTGEQGLQGIHGEQGLQGVPGEKGDTGEQGLQGVPGETGDKGDTGEQGLQGIQGEIDPVGPIGKTGAKGLKGDKGDTGPAGPTGKQGEGISATVNHAEIVSKLGTLVSSEQQLPLNENIILEGVNISHETDNSTIYLNGQGNYLFTYKTTATTLSGCKSCCAFVRVLFDNQPLKGGMSNGALVYGQTVLGATTIISITDEEEHVITLQNASPCPMRFGCTDVIVVKLS